MSTLDDDPHALAASVVRDHAHRDALAGLVARTLDRRREARATGEGIDVTSMLDPQLTPSDASTPIGNVISILDTGPGDERTRALLAALLVLPLASVPGAEREGALRAFVASTDVWLAELDLPVYALAARLLSPELFKDLVTAAIAEALASPDAAELRAYRARACVRLTALGATRNDPAREALLEVAHKSPDPALRAYASALAGERESQRPAAPASQGARLEGKSERPSARGLRAFVRVASGWALLTWALRGLERLVGVDRRVEVELVQGGIRVKERVALLGRVVRERESTFTTAALAGAAREVRFDSLYMLVGVIALALGVTTAVFFAVDAVRSGETWLLLGAAFVLLIGAGLDLALDVLWPARGGRVAVELDLLPKRSLRVARVTREDADKFLSAVALQKR